MRLFLPILGVLIGTQHRTCNTNADECLLGGTVIGGGICAAAAMILDWGVAWEKSVVAPSPAGAKPTCFALTGAGFAPTANGVRLVLAGRFLITPFRLQISAPAHGPPS